MATTDSEFQLTEKAFEFPYNLLKLKDAWKSEGYSCGISTDPVEQVWPTFSNLTKSRITVLFGALHITSGGEDYFIEAGDELLIPATVSYEIKGIKGDMTRYAIGYYLFVSAQSLKTSGKSISRRMQSSMARVAESNPLAPVFLQVTAKAARDIPNTYWLRQPSCCLELSCKAEESTFFFSTLSKAGLSPQWDESFLFPASVLMSPGKMTVRLLDRGTEIGTTEIDFIKLSLHAMDNVVTKWFPLNSNAAKKEANTTTTSSSTSSSTTTTTSSSTATPVGAGGAAAAAAMSVELSFFLGPEPSKASQHRASSSKSLLASEESDN